MALRSLPVWESSRVSVARKEKRARKFGFGCFYRYLDPCVRSFGSRPYVQFFQKRFRRVYGIFGIDHISRINGLPAHAFFFCGCSLMQTCNYTSLDIQIHAEFLLLCHFQLFSWIALISLLSFFWVTAMEKFTCCWCTLLLLSCAGSLSSCC